MPWPLVGLFQLHITRTIVAKSIYPDQSPDIPDNLTKQQRNHAFNAWNDDRPFASWLR